MTLIHLIWGVLSPSSGSKDPPPFRGDSSRRQENSSDDLQYDKGCLIGPNLQHSGEGCRMKTKLIWKRVLLAPQATPKSLAKFSFSDDFYLFYNSLLIFCYNSGIVLEKVAEYFCYNHKNRNREDVPDMEIPPELCLELLMAADYLDSEWRLCRRLFPRLMLDI